MLIASGEVLDRDHSPFGFVPSTARAAFRFDRAQTSRSAPLSAGEPSAGETRELPPPANGGHAPHVSPDEGVAMVRRLQQDRSLVDAEIVLSYPAELRVHGAGFHLHVGIDEARVEAVPESEAV